MGKQQRNVSLKGKFIKFVAGKKSPYKYLQFSTTKGKQRIQLRKALRSPLAKSLRPGDSIRVLGQFKKGSKKTDLNRLKVEDVVPSARSKKPKGKNVIAIKVPKKAKVLVCQKSSCRKRGSDAICKSLQKQLKQAGLAKQVKIQTTGCMGHCKAGPNVVMLPSKTRYSRVRQKQVAKLLQKQWG